MADNQIIWFIVNFHSGANSTEKKAKLIAEISKKEENIIHYTEYAKHAGELAQNAIDTNIAKVVAVGGDGTINEVASVLRGSFVQMGIIPMGSGNGLARHLGISMDPIEACSTIITGKSFTMDTCTINDIPFFCTAGVGFDAYVADSFAKKKKRGFITYIITSLQSFFTFQPADYQINTPSVNFNKKSFAITFANASQYGNDAVVAPDSKIDDGLLDMVILKPFSIFNSIVIGWRLFNQSFHRSKFVETIKGKVFNLKAESNFLIHFDGEPIQLNTNELTVKIEEKRLIVIVDV